jgi:protocatechuate 3,4-dioxygenase beta subunit
MVSAMDTDDLPVGRVLTRREIVRLLALGGASVLVGCDRANAGVDTTAVGTTAGKAVATSALAKAPACVVRPELTVGPYFVDRQLERSDIRSEPTTNAMRTGAPLALAFNVVDVRNRQCTPLAGAMVDVWQCDAGGVYSGFSDARMGFNTVGQTFLRGYQITDSNGSARFTTIYPGWYPGRTVHIHFKIRTPASAVLADRSSDVYEFTSQLFFDDTLSDRVFAQAPYAAKGQRDMKNADDGIYREAGSQLVLAVAPANAGYTSTFDIGLDLANTTVGRPDRGRGPGGPGGRPPRPGS